MSDDMKKLVTFLVIPIIVVPNLYSQNLNFPGTAPSLSLTIHLKKIDLNFLTANKFRHGHHTIKDIDYEPRWLEIYSQALASYKLSEHWQIAAGYGFQRKNPVRDDWRNEHRLVQQVIFNAPLGKLKFFNRFRFEERWFSYPASANAFGTRTRYQAGIIKQLSKRMVYWQFNNEIYAITSGPKNSFISENWVYTGIGFPVNGLGHLETGIGYNSIVRNSHKDLMSLILLQVNWSFVIPSKMKMHPVMYSRQF